MSKPIFDRWAEKVFIEDTSGCWLWTGALRIRSPWGDFKPSDLAYEFFIGAVPLDAAVWRICDTTNCVNPLHLCLSTDKEAVEIFTIERFWRKTRENENGCIVWIGGKAANGYGDFRWNGAHGLA